MAGHNGPVGEPQVQRIEAGSLKGRRLMGLPRGVDGLRPTAARVRGAIFDRLRDHVHGARVLDLFAGSGAMSIEALSRGAAFATLVEVHPTVVRHLHAQLQTLGLGGATRVVKADAADVLRGPPEAYDLVIIDPPFATPEVFAPLCHDLVDGWLADNALVVCERERVRGKSPPVAWPDGLTLEATRVYGPAVVEFLRR
jgi:16S rRNA (guanine966-N2)-methyltransferase